MSFFTAFGAIMDKYSIELTRAHSANLSIKEAKHDLVKHILSYMRVSVTVGVEFLLHLKEDTPSPEEREILLHNSIQEFHKLDESIRNLIKLQNNKLELGHVLLELEVVELIKNYSAKNELVIREDFLIAPRENFQVKVSSKVEKVFSL
jgi:hypothetical protein